MPAISFVPGQPAAKVHALLRRSLEAADQAHQCAVLWFAEIMRRSLYMDLGFSSINQYALQELGFSKTRTGDFIRLVRQLDNLPTVREAMSKGEVGYTKVREIISVATPETQDEWLKAAKRPRQELINEVKKVKWAAKVDPNQGELMPAMPTVVAPKELPVRFQVDMTPEQEARRAALVERIHKLGGVSPDRAELMLEALSALAESLGKAPRGTLPSRPPVQIHVHEKEGRMTVPTEAGECELSRAESDRMRCDAAICHQGGRNTTTIPPRIRREVLARDKHRCQTPGCGRTRFLEVHHLTPRQYGGRNKPENLVTLCSSCHRLWHERNLGRVGEAQPPAWSKFHSDR